MLFLFEKMLIFMLTSISISQLPCSGGGSFTFNLVLLGTAQPPAWEAAHDREFDEWHKSKSESNWTSKESKEEWPWDSLNSVWGNDHLGSRGVMGSGGVLFSFLASHDQMVPQPEDWSPSKDDCDQEDDSKDGAEVGKKCEGLDGSVELIQVEHIEDSEGVETAWNLTAAAACDMSFVVLSWSTLNDYDSGCWCLHLHWLLHLNWLLHAWLLHLIWVLHLWFFN